MKKIITSYDKLSVNRNSYAINPLYSYNPLTLSTISNNQIIKVGESTSLSFSLFSLIKLVEISDENIKKYNYINKNDEQNIFLLLF